MKKNGLLENEGDITSRRKLKNSRLKLQKIKRQLAQAENLLKAPHGAPERVREQLAYRLGSAIVSGSRGLGGFLTVPPVLIIEVCHFLVHRHRNRKQSLPPLSEYADYDAAQQVRGELSYRVGRTLLKGIRTPGGWIRLPHSIADEFSAPLPTDQGVDPNRWLKEYIVLLRSEWVRVRKDLVGRMFEWLRGKSKSQIGQDLWVIEMSSFKRNGFFVEFGATNGVSLSNSHLLEKEFGWRGICAEPNPAWFDDLTRNRQCTVSPSCIGAVTGEKVEFIFAQEYGGMVRDAAFDAHGEKREAYRLDGCIAVLETISLNDFLIKHGAPRDIDYISIDTEGSEYAILETFPFDKWNVRLFTIEHNYTPQREKIRELMQGHGYTFKKAQFDDWYYKQADENEL